MEKHLLLIYFLFLFAFSSNAQNVTGLELKNHKTQNSRFIKNGTKVKIVKLGTEYKGVLKVISDQAITVGYDTLLLGEIQELSARTTSRTVGGLAMAAPSALLGIGGTVFLISGILDTSGYGFIGVILGVPGMAVGAIGVYYGIRLIKGKRFNASRWQFIASNQLVVLNPS